MRPGLRANCSGKQLRGLTVCILALAGCETVVVDPIPLVDLQVIPTQVTVLEGEQRSLQARLLGPGGEELGGRPVAWSVESSTVASITPQGVLSGLSEGSTTVEAEVEGLSVTVPVTVLRGPDIGLAPATLAISAPSGQVQPIVRDVTVTNLGNGSLSQLTRTVVRDDAPGVGWLLATLQGQSAPTVLQFQVVVTGLAPGLYRGRVTVADPSARNGPQTVEVEVQVGEPLPVIRLTPATVQVGAASGTREPASVDVDIENVGGGTLQGLQTTIRYLSSGPQGWLVAALAGPAAPTTLSLEASAEFLPGREEPYVAEVDVTASTPGVVGTVRVTFLVAP